MRRLNVQIDHVATLREAEKTSFPDPVAAAILAELGGADGICAHLREDRRHVQDRDLRVLRRVIQTRLILKMAATSEMLGVALNIKPDMVVLVPEKREAITVEGGLDLMVHRSNVAETISNLENGGIPVGIFIDADPEQLKLAHQCNAKMVEIQTGVFQDAATNAKRNQVFARIVDAVKLADRLKIKVHVGYGLCYDTVKTFKGLGEIDEFTIGHSILSRALLVGMEKAVKDMRALIAEI